MSGFFENIARRALFALDAEQAHGLSIAALKTGVLSSPVPLDPVLQQCVAGLKFINPLGMAAGFDKNAEVPDALLKLGFGFAEVGTITPRAQTGNPKPRIFRLVEDRAVINRLGFNNEGHESAYKRLSQRNSCATCGIVGVNIGANKDSEDRVADYVAGIHRFYSVAKYFTANVSSPNTPGLRDLQAKDSLHILLEKVLAARDQEAGKCTLKRPVFLKIAPDLTEEGLDDIAQVALSHPLDGLIIANTTVSRTNLINQVEAQETGGLSGSPIFERSTIVLAKMRQRIGKAMPLIGVGGVDSGDTALTKIKAGADLVQLYTGMIYRGPTVPKDIVKELSALVKQAGVANISEMRDLETTTWAAKDIPV